MRINKFLALCGVCSRRKAEEHILAGMVKVNGQVVTNLATNIDEKKDVVLLGSQQIVPTQQSAYLMLNKPKGCVCTMQDDRGRKTVADFVCQVDNRVFPVGRLDYDSEGLLLFTNDGDLAFKLTHPKFEVEKTYVVKVEGQMKESELAVLRAGVVVNNVRFGKCKVKLLQFQNNISKLEVVLREGKNREIRKMFDCIGKKVIFLKRTQFAGLKLGGLSRGEIRPLHQDEILYLKNLTNTNIS